jgi:hypothetical protein
MEIKLDTVDTIPMAVAAVLEWEYDSGSCVRMVIFINFVHQTYHLLLLLELMDW